MCWIQVYTTIPNHNKVLKCLCIFIQNPILLVHCKLFFLTILGNYFYKISEYLHVRHCAKPFAYYFITYTYLAFTYTKYMCEVREQFASQFSPSTIQSSGLPGIPTALVLHTSIHLVLTTP